MLNWREGEVVVCMAAGVGISSVLSIMSEAIFVMKVHHNTNRKVAFPRANSNIRAQQLYLAWTMRDMPYAREDFEAVTNLVKDDVTSRLQCLICVDGENKDRHCTVIHVGQTLNRYGFDRVEQRWGSKSFESAESQIEIDNRLRRRLKFSFGAFRKAQMVEYLSEIVRRHPDLAIRVPCCGPPAFIASVMDAVFEVSRHGVDIQCAWDSY